MAARKSKAVSGRSRRLRIDELLTYWTNLSKRPTLAREDFRTFVQMTEKTLDYFFEYYGSFRPSDVQIAKDRFFRAPYSLVWHQRDIAKKVLESPRLSDHYCNLMKEYANKFIPRIKKCFAQQLARSQIEKTFLQDAEHLLSFSTKLTYRWAAGIIVSNRIAKLLIRISNYTKGERFRDDISTLRDNLKNGTKNPEALTRQTLPDNSWTAQATKPRRKPASKPKHKPTSAKAVAFDAPTPLSGV